MDSSIQFAVVQFWTKGWLRPDSRVNTAVVGPFLKTEEAERFKKDCERKLQAVTVITEAIDEDTFWKRLSTKGR